MNLLDRYIARLYLANILALGVALGSFVVGIDVVLNMKRFVEAARTVAPEGASALSMAAFTALGVIDIWGPRLVQLLAYLSSLVLVAGMGFTCANLLRRRELVAALASGVSLHRLAVPFVIVGAGVLGVSALTQELVLPRVAHLLPRSAREAHQRTLDTVRVPLLADGSGRLWYAASFDPEAEVMHGVSVWERARADDGMVVTRRIEADQAGWDGRRWVLTGAREEAVDASGAIPLPEGFGVQTDLDPTMVLVRRVRGYGQSLSWRQIGRTLQIGRGSIDPAERRRLETIRWGRPALIAANLLGLIIALPFFLQRAPVSIVTQALKCGPVVVLAMVGGALGAAAPLQGVPVQVGVFLPTLVLLPVAIAAVSLVKT